MEWGREGESEKKEWVGRVKERRTERWRVREEKVGGDERVEKGGGTE